MDIGRFIFTGQSSIHKYWKKVRENKTMYISIMTQMSTFVSKQKRKEKRRWIELMRKWANDIRGMKTENDKNDWRRIDLFLFSLSKKKK